MKIEIEKKFLIKNMNFIRDSFKKIRITQRYLSSLPERSIRIRIGGDKAFITIKGKSNKTGMSRSEWEKDITVEDAQDLFKICEPGVIDKTRYLVKSGNHTIEVDEYYGENNGLIVAEIELLTEEESFEKPDWLGDEITGDTKYYNSYLMKHPYTKWKD